jgi:sialic acid synthase SpsE
MKGTDHLGSLEPQGLWKMVRDIRNMEVALKEKPLFLECETEAKNKLRVYEGRDK